MGWTRLRGEPRGGDQCLEAIGVQHPGWPFGINTTLSTLPPAPSQVLSWPSVGTGLQLQHWGDSTEPP